MTARDNSYAVNTVKALKRKYEKKGIGRGKDSNKRRGPSSGHRAKKARRSCPLPFALLPCRSIQCYNVLRA